MQAWMVGSEAKGSRGPLCKRFVGCPASGIT
jgi:hypothetical protein